MKRTCSQNCLVFCSTSPSSSTFCHAFQNAFQALLLTHLSYSASVGTLVPYSMSSQKQNASRRKIAPAVGYLTSPRNQKWPTPKQHIPPANMSNSILIFQESSFLK